MTNDKNRPWPLGESKTFQLSDGLYAHVTPYRTDYMKGKGEGIAYKVDRETAFERAAAFGGSIEQNSWTVISLLSPYITGFGWETYPNQLEIESLDIPNRSIIIKRVK